MYFFFDHLIFIFIAILLPFISWKSNAFDVEEELEYEMPPKKHLYVSNGLMLCIGALIIITAWNVSDRPWTILGFQYIKWDTVAMFLSILFGILYVYEIFQSWTEEKNIQNSENQLERIVPSEWSDLPAFIFLSICAGICEEIIYRGFIISYVTNVFGFLPIISIFLSALIFTIMHAYQGKNYIYKIFAFSILFGLLYIRTESLYLIIILHCGVDIFSGIVSILKSKTS